jgi:hypothetical protein
MFSVLKRLILTTYIAHLVGAFNFPYEAIQLRDSDINGNPDIAFGQLPVGVSAKCKVFPGDNSWPSAERWTTFNTSLGGALIHSPPPAAACYEGPFQDATKCNVLKTGLPNSLIL